MIITAKFRKDRTSIQTFRIACGLYIRAIISTGRRTAVGRCEPSVREQSVMGMPMLFYRMRQKQHTKERCGIISRRDKNMFLTVVIGSCHFVREKLHTPLANVEPLRPIRAAGENEPKRFGFIYRDKQQNTH